MICVINRSKLNHIPSVRCENHLWFLLHELYRDAKFRFSFSYCDVTLCQYREKSRVIWFGTEYQYLTRGDGIISTIVQNKHFTVHEKHHSTAPSAVCQNSTHLCAQALRCCWFSFYLVSILLTTYSLIWSTVFWPIRGRGCGALPYDGPPLPSRNQSQNYLFSGWLCCCCGFLNAANASEYAIWLDLCLYHSFLCISNCCS